MINWGVVVVVIVVVVVVVVNHVCVYIHSSPRPDMTEMVDWA